MFFSTSGMVVLQSLPSCTRSLSDRIALVNRYIVAHNYHGWMFHWKREWAEWVRIWSAGALFVMEDTHFFFQTKLACFLFPCQEHLLQVIMGRLINIILQGHDGFQPVPLSSGGSDYAHQSSVNCVWSRDETLPCCIMGWEVTPVFRSRCRQRRCKGLCVRFNPFKALVLICLFKSSWNLCCSVLNYDSFLRTVLSVLWPSTYEYSVLRRKAGALCI